MPQKLPQWLFDDDEDSDRGRSRGGHNPPPIAASDAGTRFAFPHGMHLHIEWNDNRSTANLRDTGIRFEEAATVLGDPLSRTITDPAHAADAGRFVTFGLSNRARMLVVSHIDRGAAVWIIAARRAIRGQEPPKKPPGESAPATTERNAEYDFSAGAQGEYAARYWEAAARGHLRRAQPPAAVRFS